MYSEVKVLTDSMSVAVGVGTFQFALGPLSLAFYRQVKILGVQTGLETRTGIQNIEASGYLVLQFNTNKGNSFGSFGGGLFYTVYKTGQVNASICEIDVPANTSVTVIGSGALHVAAPAPSQVILYVDILYKVKHF